MKRKISLIIICHFLTFSLMAQYQLSLANQSFNYFPKKGNIVNKWSWFKISLSKQITPKYTLGVDALINSSYLFIRDKNSLIYNEIPRSKNIFQNIGLGIKNEFLLKDYNNIVSWSLVNSTSILNIPIYSTHLNFIDSTHYYYTNLYSNNRLIFSNSTNLKLNAIFSKQIKFTMQYGLIYTHLKDSYSINKSVLRTNFEVGFIYYFSKKEE